MATIQPPATLIPAAAAPAPQGQPFFGVARDLIAGAPAYLSHLADTYGPFVRFNVFFKQFYLVSDPELIREVLVTQAANFPKDDRDVAILDRTVGHGLVSANGEEHKRQRRLTQPAFHTRRIDAYAGTMVDYTTAMLDEWRDGQAFDVWTSAAIFIGYAIPSFMFAILLIILFAGGRYWDLFPLRGILSDDWQSLSVPALIMDYLWHMVLPVTALVVSGFAGLTMLTKNSFLEEIGKQYLLTARAKGLSERRVLYGHIFRNAMLIVIAGFPAAFLSVFFTGALLIEVVFSLDGLGLLGYESIMNRDYPVVLGTLYVFSLMGLLTTLVRDVTYVLVDPRIDFADRRA